MIRRPPRISGPRRTAALLFSLVLGGLSLSGCRAGPGALPDSSTSLRYELREAAPSSNYMGSFVAVDLDGDGVDEEVKIDEGIGGASFLSLARIQGNQFYALHTRHLLSKSGVIGTTDTTGDGTADLVWWWHSAPEHVQVFVSDVSAVESSAELATLHSIKLDTSASLLPDGQWGACACVHAALDTDADGATDALVLGVSAGITLRPRELLYWDLDLDKIAWRLPTGATPTGGSAAVDVTGDGRPELFVGLEAPGNGAAAGDWDDGHSYLIAVDADGNVLWWRQLAGFSSNVEIAAADLDGDGTVEIITAINYHSTLDAVGPELAVWRGNDGALLDTLRVGHPTNAVLVAECEDGKRIFSGSADGALRRMRWEPGSLKVESTLDCRDAVEAMTTFVPRPLFDEWRLAVGTGRGTVAVLDERLNPLAALELNETLDGARRLRATTVASDGGASGGLIVRTRDRTHRYVLKRRPLPLWTFVLVPVLTALALMLSVPASRRAALAALRRWVLPRDTRDESVEELITALATAGHGKLAATSTLRRLSRQSEMMSSGEGAVPDAFEERFMDAVSNALDVGIPGLEAIARLSERVGTAPYHTRRLSAALDDFRALMKSLPGGLPTPGESAALREQFERALPHLDEALLGIKSAAESERSSSLGAELGRALRSRREDFQEFEIEFEGPSPGALASARVLGTPQELSFVLDNLLGNAIDAMRDRPVRLLRISIEMGPKWIVLKVEDTGRGIEESRHDLIFAPGISDRGGGGHGLPASRKMLARRGGRIELVRSAPDEGAVFEIRLLVCQKV